MSFLLLNTLRLRTFRYFILGFLSLSIKALILLTLDSTAAAVVITAISVFRTEAEQLLFTLCVGSH